MQAWAPPAASAAAMVRARRRATATAPGRVTAARSAVAGSGVAGSGVAGSGVQVTMATRRERSRLGHGWTDRPGVSRSSSTMSSPEGSRRRSARCAPKTGASSANPTAATSSRWPVREASGRSRPRAWPPCWTPRWPPARRTPARSAETAPARRPAPSPRGRWRARAGRNPIRRVLRGDAVPSTRGPPCHASRAAWSPLRRRGPPAPPPTPRAHAGRHGQPTPARHVPPQWRWPLVQVALRESSVRFTVVR